MSTSSKRPIARMCLIPEVLYTQLMTLNGNKSSPILNSADCGMEVEDEPLIESANTLSKITLSKMNDDAKQINYMQEYKRLRNYRKSKHDRPVLVRNIDSGSTTATMNVNNEIPAISRDTTPQIREHVPILNLDDSAEIPTTTTTPSVKNAMDEVLAYVYKHRDTLKVTHLNQIFTSGKLTPIRNSDVEDIVEYQMYNEHNSKKAPPGTASFMKHARKDLYLVDKLTRRKTPHQSGTGAFSMFKVYKKRTPHTFTFKPALW
jgi:hypothetical protein